MSDAHVTEEVHKFEVDCNDPAIQEQGVYVAKEMIKLEGLSTATGVLLVALYEIFCMVLHSRTPMPEANVAACAQMLDALKAKTLIHEDCALKINGVGKKQVKH